MAVVVAVCSARRLQSTGQTGRVAFSAAGSRHVSLSVVTGPASAWLCGHCFALALMLVLVLVVRARKRFSWCCGRLLPAARCWLLSVLIDLRVGPLFVVMPMLVEFVRKRFFGLDYIV